MILTCDNRLLLEEIQMRNKAKKFAPAPAFLLILILSSIVRILLSVFPKTASVYNDELFYLELSQNFYLRGVLSVYSTPINFTKLLYSLLLSPFYAVSNGVLRTQLISAFNALLISSSLIPGYLLARRVLKKNWQILFAVIFLAISPNLLFSITFMAENLYYPLLIWGFYASCRFFLSGRKPLHAFLLGLFAFLLYFAKEVGAAFVVAVVASFMADRMGNKKSRKEVYLPLGCYLLGVILPYGILHLTLLRSAGYSYAAQVTFSALSDASHILFFLYAAVVMLLYFLLTVLFIPAVLPFIRFKNLSPAGQTLLVQAAVYVLSVAVGIAFGVSLHSDYPHPDIRVHLRYFLGAAFPFLLLFLSSLEGSEPVSHKNTLVTSTALFAGLLIVLLQIPKFGSLVDSPVLDFTRLLDRTSPVWCWLFKLAPVVLLGIVLLLWNKKRKQACACLLSILLAFEVLSGVLFIGNAKHDEEMTDTKLLTEVQQLDAFLDESEGTTLILAESSWVLEMRLLNTLSNDDYFFATVSDIRSRLVSENSSAFPRLIYSESSIPDTLASYSGKEKLRLTKADRIVTIGDSVSPAPDNHKEITPDGISRFHVYNAQDPSRLSLLDPLSYNLGNEILFLGDNPDFRNYLPVGFSLPESTHTWTGADSVSLTLAPSLSEPVDLTLTWSWRMTIGEQPCRVYVNDIPVYDCIISGTQGWDYCTIPAGTYAETGVLKLRFDFPEARQPGNGDPRTLAVAFERLFIDIE